MSWLEIKLQVNKYDVEPITEFFDSNQALSVTYMDAENNALYEIPVGETVVWDHTEITALYDDSFEIEPLIKLFNATFDHLKDLEWNVNTLVDRVWEQSWMEYFKPMLFADKLWVCPTEQQIYTDDTHCLILDPGLAFGTGTHQTTALCLEWLASHDLKNQVLIDFGSGSGILSVAGAILGAEKIYAFDIDPQAITATQSNAKKNKVEEKVYCSLADNSAKLKANIVIANILVQPLCDLAGQISSYLSVSGQLVLSGILTEQADKVIHCYNKYNFSFKEPVIDGDWCRLEGQKIS